MLKGVPTVISPELMHVMMKMGHGDELVLADGNFPADSSAQRIVRADGFGVMDLLGPILQFFPLDDFEPPAYVMQPVDAAIGNPPIWSDFLSTVNEHADKPVQLERIERFAFYDRSKAAYAIVATSETAIYGNLILKKGVIS